jgi:uncharacterized membrane protein
MSARDAFVIGASVGMGIVAGVFFAFSAFVMPALARLPAAQGAATMQSINVTAINPWFMTALFGTGLVAITLSATSLGSLGIPRARWLLGGTIIYLAGAIAVTMFANVPRNDALAIMNADAAAAYFPRYLAEWNVWNHVRTVTSVIATTCLVMAARS